MASNNQIYLAVIGETASSSSFSQTNIARLTFPVVLVSFMVFLIVSHLCFLLAYRIIEWLSFYFSLKIVQLSTY
jgi:hypothetical protein